MKQVIVTFNYDPETDAISDVKCAVDGVEKKKRTTKSKKDVAVELESEAVITLEPNKLVFNNKAVADLEIAYEDRIIIKWVAGENKKMVPIIGKDTSFNEEGAGNKVTKSNTVTYKGNANKILAEFGTVFTLEPYKDGIWRLISNKVGGTISEPTIELDDVIKQAESLEVDLLTEEDDNIDLDMTFKL